MASRHIGSVYIRVVPDTKDFRRQTQRAFDRMEPFKVPVEVEVDQAETRRKFEAALDDVQRRAKPHKVDVTPDMEGFEADVDEGVEKATRGKDFTVKVTSDVDGVMDALATMERELAALQRTREIKFDLNAKDIEAQMDQLYKELEAGFDAESNALTASVQVRPDEQGYREVVRKIEEVRALQERPIDFEFGVDEANIRQAWDDAHEELARARNRKPLLPEKIMLEYDATSREDLDQQIAELERRLRSLQSDKVTIPVDLDQDGIQSALNELHARRRNVDLHPRVNPFALGMAEGQLAAAARDRWVDLKPRLARSAMRDLSGAFMAIAGLNSIRTLVDQIREITLNFDEWAFAVGTASAAIGSLASVATAGLGALLSIAGDTLQVFQGLAMAPALMLSGATALQTWTAIWQDFEAALMGIPGVLEDMPPAAQSAVGAIEDLNEAVNQSVQQNFWGRMTDEVERFTESIGPHIVRAMGETADVMGRVISNMLDYTETLAEGGSLEVFTENNTRAMGLLGDAAERVFRSLMNMGIHGSQYLPVLAGHIDNLAARFEAFINDAIATGKFDQWIENSVKSLQSLGKTISATWSIFAGFTRAFEDVGGPGLHEMADGLERVSDWVNSSGTQQALRDMFSAAMEGASAAGEGIGDLVSALWDYRDVVNEALVVTGKLAGEFLTGISKVDPTVVFRGFFDLMDGLRDFVRIAQPGFESIANVFGRLGSIGGEVAREVAHGMNLTMDAIDGFIARIEGPLIDAIHPLTRVFEDIAALGGPVLWKLADSLAVVLNLFNALPGPIQNVLTLLMILGRTGVLAGLQQGMQNFTRGLGATRQSVFRFTSDVENSTTRMRNRVAANMAAMGTSMRQAFTGASMVGPVNRAAGQVESRLDRMRVQVAATMGRIRGAMGRAFGGLVGALGGPWGIALTAAIGTLSAFAGASAEAEAAQDRLRDSVNAVTGAIEDQAVVEAYDQLTDSSQSWLDKFWNGAKDMEEIFSTMGTSAGELARGLQGPTEEVQKMADAARELAGLDVHFLDDLREGDFSKISSDAQEIYERLNLSELSAQDFYSAMQLIADIYGPIADQADHVKNRTDEVGDAAEGAAGDIEAMSSAADGLTPKFESMANAMETLADETSTAEQRVSALDTAMKLLNGEELSLDEQMAYATESVHDGMKEIERLAQQGGFDASKAFNEAGEFDLSESIEAVEIKQPMDRLRAGILAEMDILKQQLDEGIIDQSTFEAGIAALEDEYNGLLESAAKALGMTEEETRAFMEFMNKDVSFDPLEIEALYDPEPMQQAQEDWKVLSELGLEMDQSEYVAELDADGSGYVDEQERVTGMGKAFDELLFEAGLSGDKAEYDRIMAAAMEEGYLFNGKNFVAVLDADGQPTEEGIRLARERGLAWDGEEFVAVADVKTDEATDKLVDSVNKAQGVWDGEEFIAKLDANGEPTEEMLAYAESLGLAWNGSEFVAVVDADGEGADEEITANREKALRFEGVYKALLEAGVPASSADDIAEAIASVEEFEGDYEALLEAVQTEEGREALEGALSSLDEIPDEVRSDIIAFLTGEEDLEWLQSRLDELDGTETSTKVDADTEEADNKIDNTATSAQRLGLLNPLVSLGIIGDDHVINRSGEAEGAANRVEGPRLATLLSAGAPAVVAAAFSAFTEADKVDGNFLAVLLSTGAAGVISQASAAFSEADTVDDVFTAIFGETGAGHVMSQAGGIQGAISRIDRNPVVTFVGRVASSFWNAISRIRSAISGVSGAAAAAGVGGLLSRNGSLTGSRFKPEMFRAFANGGVERHVAQIAMPTPSTPIRIWAEPETGGEAYIPLSPAKRARSLQIWQETGRRLGAFADGGVTGGSQQVESGGDVYYITVEGDNLSTKDIVNEMTHQRRRRGRR